MDTGRHVGIGAIFINQPREMKANANTRRKVQSILAFRNIIDHGVTGIDHIDITPGHASAPRIRARPPRSLLFARLSSHGRARAGLPKRQRQFPLFLNIQISQVSLSQEAALPIDTAETGDGR